MRDVLLAAAQYAPCRIVDAGPGSEPPPSTEPMPGAPKKVGPLTLRAIAAQKDVAGPASPWNAAAPSSVPVYRAVPPPPRSPSRPASPTPVEPIRAFRPAQMPEASSAVPQVKKHDSYYPMEVPIEAPRGVRESSMFPAFPGPTGPRRSAMGWALGGLAAFAIVLGLLTVADRARAKAFPTHESAASLPRATSELPVARPWYPTHSVAQPHADRPALPQDVRGIDPADLPDTKGVDVSTLPLVSTAAPARAARTTSAR